MRPGMGFLIGLLSALLQVSPCHGEDTYQGKFFSGSGDVEYLRLLDIARRMFDPDPQYQNLAMLYTPNWNGLVEGPTWGAWWIQNSYGTTYCALPFLTEPWITFLENSHDLWFSQMGDGQRKGAKDWIAPDGCLCDCASPGWIYYKQGDGRIDLHDWGMEFTAAGLLMQAELLLISRDQTAISHYLPLLERNVAFIETRRDPQNDLFLAGPAGNLLAPSYAGWKGPDGTYGQAYLTGLSITYIAALDRMIELEKLVGNSEKSQEYQRQHDAARRGLEALMTPEGYLIRSLDPDGTRHGVFGASQHGYFEASPNHDAVALRVVDDGCARRILAKIDSIPQLRPYDFVLPNYPSYDDMYEKPEGLWEFGTWVNGGHWSTCEARMMMAYARLGKYEDARRSMKRILTFADRFRMDNPLTKYGSDVYQPKEPINLCYDSFGPSAGIVRGLFEYLYRNDELILIPHVPPSINSLEQHFPIRFGNKQIYLSTVGKGAITGVLVNGNPCETFEPGLVHLSHETLPEVAAVQICLGDVFTESKTHTISTTQSTLPDVLVADLPTLATRIERLKSFHQSLYNHNLGNSYEAAHARVALDAISVIPKRAQLLTRGEFPSLPEPSGAAAEQVYHDTAGRLFDGLEKVMKNYRESADPAKTLIADFWFGGHH